MRAYLVGLVAVGVGTVSGCGLTLDLEPDPDGGSEVDFGVVPNQDLGVPPTDGGPLRECEGRADGTSCGGTGVEPYLCIGGECVPGECGDGFVTGDELCDDGNTEDGDGCQATCRPGCVTSGGCPSTECATGVCESGRCVAEPVADATNCSGGMCMDGECVPPLCGNGVIDEGETCDDGNRVGRDGCEPDCTPSCGEDGDCEDGVLCNGEERCVGHDDGRATCEPPDALPALPRVCAYCDEATGLFELRDEDGDGFTAVEGDDCGPTDCDDRDPTVYPGAPETTTGVDSNCDGEFPTSDARLCFRDADDDGYGDPSDVVSMPGGAGTPCPLGYIPLGAADCDDENAMVNPGQLMFFQRDYCDLDGSDCSWDYNCDGREERKITQRASCLGTTREECEAGREGWAGLRIPECGERAAFGECTWTPLVGCRLALLPELLTQACR